MVYFGNLLMVANFGANVCFFFIPILVHNICMIFVRELLFNEC